MLISQQQLKLNAGPLDNKRATDRKDSKVVVVLALQSKYDGQLANANLFNSTELSAIIIITLANFKVTLT